MKNKLIGTIAFGTAFALAAGAADAGIPVCPAGQGLGGSSVGKSTTVCSDCDVGFYNDGTTIPCMRCPAGYISNPGAVAARDCIITCLADAYVATAGAAGCTPCPSGTRSPGLPVHFGQTSACTAG